VLKDLILGSKRGEGCGGEKIEKSSKN